jgi:hypothetical protein
VLAIDRLRQAVRSVPAYVALRRWQREGFVRAYRRVQLWRTILTTPPVRTAPRSPDAVEVHLLCYRLDYLAAIWTLKTFYRASGVEFPLVIHVSGAVGRRMFDRLRAHFPDAAIIPQTQADHEVEARLAAGGFTRLADARRASAFMLKLTDFPLLAAGATVLGLDSDVLFFAPPRELLEHAARPGCGYLFQRDPESTYNLTEATALQDFGIRLVPRVNTGILVYPRELPDLAAFERYLAHPDVARPTGYIEQTLYALHASELGAAEYLPDSYLIDLRPNLPHAGLTARHYAGPSRTLLTAEGMPHILGAGLLGGSS